MFPLNIHQFTRESYTGFIFRCLVSSFPSKILGNMTSATTLSNPCFSRMYQPYLQILWQCPRGAKLHWRHRRTICTTCSTQAHIHYVWLCYYIQLTFFHFLLFNTENTSNNSALVSFNLIASEISNSPQPFWFFAGWTTQQSVLYQLWLEFDFPLFRLSSSPPQLQPY